MKDYTCELSMDTEVASIRNCFSGPNWKTNTKIFNFNSKYMYKRRNAKKLCLTMLSATLNY